MNEDSLDAWSLGANADVPQKLFRNSVTIPIAVELLPEEKHGPTLIEGWPSPNNNSSSV